MSKVILSLDIGTSKLCALAVDAATRRPLAMRTAPNDADVLGLPPHWHEQSPLRIRDLCFSLLRDVAADDALCAAEVAGIALTGQMHGVLLVDQRLEPVTNLITWRDRRSADEGAPGRLSDCVNAVGEGAPHRVGCRLAHGYGGVTLRWLRGHGLPLARCRALSITGYLAAGLTGIARIDPTYAASWGVWDLAADDWDHPSLQALGIPGTCLPPVAPSSQPCGQLTPEAARALGLPAACAVFAPVGDNQASFVGAAGFDRHALVINLGTGGQISMWRPDCAYVDGLETRPMPFRGFLQAGASLCGGWSYAYWRQFAQAMARELAGVELSDAEAYARLNALAAGAPDGADGLSFDTRFDGSRLDPSARGAVSGIDTRNLTPALLTRALLEGMVRELWEAWQVSGLATPARIVACGNAAQRIPVLQSIIERRFGAPCAVSAEPEQAALGAARAALAGLDG
jgi:sugar (pentulose or hexulose) kinase